MELIISPSKNDTSKLNKLGITFLTFEEKFQLWIKESKKKRTRIGLITPEIFSLSYDSTVSELKNALFLQIYDDEQLSLVDKDFNVIEYV